MSIAGGYVHVRAKPGFAGRAAIVSTTTLLSLMIAYALAMLLLVILQPADAASVRRAMDGQFRDTSGQQPWYGNDERDGRGGRRDGGRDGRRGDDGRRGGERRGGGGRGRRQRLTAVCYRFGDCIDAHQTESHFYSTLLYYYADDLSQQIGSLLDGIERNLTGGSVNQPKSKRDDYDASWKSRPLRPCVPLDEDVKGAVGGRYARKFYSTFALADRSRAIVERLVVVNADTVDRLQFIQGRLSPVDNATTSTILPSDAMLQESLEYVRCWLNALAPFQFGPNDLTPQACGRDDDCMNRENKVNHVFLAQGLCAMRAAAIGENASLAIIERALQLPPYVAPPNEPFDDVAACVVSWRDDVPSTAYLEKVSDSYAIANRTKFYEYTTANHYRNVVVRLQRIAGALPTINDD